MPSTKGGRKKSQQEILKKKINKSATVLVLSKWRRGRKISEE